MTCKKPCFVTLDDVNRWIDDDKPEILACLTWHVVKGRKPPYLLFIPSKMHIMGHSFLKEFYKEEWKGNDECIFYHDGSCRLGKLKPETCKPMTQTDEENQHNTLYKERELVSKMIHNAKLEASKPKLAKLIMDYDHKSKPQAHTEDKNEEKKL